MPGLIEGFTEGHTAGRRFTRALLVGYGLYSSYGYPASSYSYSYPAYGYGGYGYGYPAYGYGYGGVYRPALYGGYRVARRVANRHRITQLLFGSAKLRDLEAA